MHQAGYMHLPSLVTTKTATSKFKLNGRHHKITHETLTLHRTNQALHACSKVLLSSFHGNPEPSNTQQNHSLAFEVTHE